MAQPNWKLNLWKTFFPRNPKHGKFTRLPGVGKWFEKRLCDGDHIITLPRDKVVPVDQSVQAPDQLVLPTKLLDHFIDKMDFHWIMDFCICRSSMSCKDYPIEYGCLFMGEAARGINPEWGRSVTKE